VVTETFQTKLSEAAQLIARRAKSATVEPIHIALAFSYLNPRRFASLRQSNWGNLEARLDATKAPDYRGTNFGVFAQNFFASERGEDDLWEQLSYLLQEQSDPRNSDSEVANISSTQKESSTSPESRNILFHEISVATSTREELVSNAFNEEVSEIISRIGEKQIGSSSDDSDLLFSVGQGSDIEHQLFHQILKLLVNAEGEKGRDLAYQFAERLVEMVGENLGAEGFNHPLLDITREHVKEAIGNGIDAGSRNSNSFDSEFSELIGLHDVKRTLRKFLDLLDLERLREERGLKAPKTSLHIAFLGAPGTGKTEVARRYGKILKAMNVLEKGQFIEVDRSELVGKYVGETEEKTSKILKRAIGGVLFIDEAYSLNDQYSSGKGFGAEAVDTIVRFMENNRENFVLILAGYESEIRELLKVNPGLMSRVPTLIEFADYGAQDLAAIFVSIANRAGFQLSADIQTKLGDYFTPFAGKDEFGNARGVRNLFESTMRNVASRASKLGNLATMADINTIYFEDIPFSDFRSDKDRPTFGFSPNGR
jgi:stage V sporulation protein K